MIRRKTGLKEIAIGSLLGVALVSVACSDGDEQPLLGSAGTAGSTAAGMSNGGSNTAGTSNTAGNGGTSTAGTSNTAGTSTGGTSTAGTGGNDGGMPNSAGAGGQAAGEGGEGGAGGDWAAGGQGGAGQGGEGGEPFVADTLDNPGFEVGTQHVNIPGWTNEGTTGAAYIEYAEAHSGFGKLGHWVPWVTGGANPNYTARTFQTVSPIANGTYSFSMWVKRDWLHEQYLFVRGHNAAALDEEKQATTAAAEGPEGYLKITVSGIVVTSGSITVGVYTNSSPNSYANFDDAELTRE